MMKLSVIIPVYNEETTIQEILQQGRAVGLAHEIVIVDDGATDRTRELLKAEESQPGTIVIYHDHNQCKGAAVRRERQQDHRGQGRAAQNEKLGAELDDGDLDEQVGDTPDEPEGGEQDDATTSH